MLPYLCFGILNCRQRCRVVRAHDCDQHGIGSKPTSVVSLENTLYGPFLSLVILARSYKFQSYLYEKTVKLNKAFNQTAIFWHFRKQVGVISCPMYSASVAFL